MADTSSRRNIRHIGRRLQRVFIKEEPDINKNDGRRVATLPADSPQVAAPPKPGLAAPNSSSKSLWDEVYDSELSSATLRELYPIAKRLREDLNAQKLVTDKSLQGGANLSREWRVCNQVLHLATEKRLQLQNASRSSLSEHAVRARQAYENIALWAQKFVQIGDVIAQVDPLHVGVPWSGIRLVLLFAAYDHQNDAAVLEGVATMSKLIYRYAVFEDVYLRGDHPLQSVLKGQLESAVKDLYAAVLLYLLKVNKYFSATTTERLIETFSLNEDLTQLAKEIAAKETEVQNYERIAIRAASYTQFLEVRKILGAYDDHLQAEQREKILDWVSSMPYHAHHRDIFDRVLAGTGGWFLERKQFLRWCTSGRSRLLWLRGDAGTGKSNLISCVVNRLLEQPRLDSTEAVAYFYCSRTSSDTERQDPQAILRSLIRQLASPLPGLPIKPPVLSKYKQEKSMGSRQARLSIRDCESLLTELIQQHYKHVMIVLDALDECDAKARADLFTVLARLAYTQEAVVKVLISSRSEPDLLDYFGSSSNLYINAEDNAEDISKYVDVEIDGRLLHGKASETVRTLVKHELKRKAQGMFRWAALQVDSLCDPEYVHGEDDVHELLRTLPETLETTYTETLTKFQRYPKFSREAILNALKLMLCAEYPMDATEVLSGTLILSHTASPKLDGSDLVRMSRSLIVEDRQSPILRFAHLSVREYLERHPDFSGESIHTVAAEACLKTFLAEQTPALAVQNDNLQTATTFRDRARSFFHSYALTHLGRHCRKSGAYRNESRLQRMLSLFLVEEEGRAAFDQWNRDCFQTDLETAPGTCDERRNCSSRPAQPLFMACVYGFDEIAERIVAKDNSALEAENFYSKNPLEVAALYGNYQTTTILYKSATVNRKACIRTERLLQSAAGGAPAILEFLLEQDIELLPSNSTVFAAAAAAAAGNTNYGEEMLRMLLQKTGPVDEATLRAIVSSCSSVSMLDFLLSHIEPLKVTESTLLAAVRNRQVTRQLVEMFLIRSRDIFITEEVLTTAAIGHKDTESSEVVGLLLHHPNHCTITEEILHNVASHGYEQSVRSLELVLAQVDDLEITEDLLAAAARNMFGGPAILKLFLQRTKTLQITQKILQSAILNRWHAMESLKILLSYPSCPKFAEETLYIMTETWSGQGDVFRTVLERSETIPISETLIQNVARHRNADDMEYLLSLSRAFPISKATIMAAIHNSFEGAPMTRLLLEHATDVQFQLSEDVLVTSMDSSSSALEIVEYLYRKYGFLPVTENVIKAAVKNYRDAKHLLDLLIKVSGGIVVTSGILEAAAEQSDLEVIQYLLQHKGDIDISESMLKSAIQPYATNSGVLKVLLSQKGRPSITEAVLETAAQRGSMSTMELLSAQPEAPKPTSRMIELAASNSYHGGSAMRCLLSVQDLSVTETAMIEAAANTFTGEETMRLLLSKLESPSVITEKVLQTAASNGICGKALVMQILLSKPESKWEISEKILQLALSKAATPSPYSSELSTSVLGLLLGHITQSAPKIEPLVEAAAERGDGKWILQYLLRHFGDIPVTQHALKAAAGNEEAGISVMKLLLNQPNVSLSSDVLLTAASNRYQGTEMMKLLLGYSQQSIELGEEVIITALSNSICGRSLLAMLLSRDWEFKITSDIIDAASSNDTFGKFLLLGLLQEAIVKHNEWPIQKLYEKVTMGPDGLRDSLLIAICEGEEELVKFLLVHNADVTTHAGELGTALDVAVHAGILNIVELLLHHEASVHSSSSLRGSALKAACDGGHLEIAQFLASHGADIDQVDSMGRTLLHRALREAGENALSMVDWLFSAGASVTSLDHQKLSAMHHAAFGNYAHGIERLLELHSSTEEEDSYGWTPLHWGARCGSLAAVEKLLEAGAKKTKTDSKGRTAFNVAAICGNRHLQALLWTSDISNMNINAGDRTALGPTFWCDACGLKVYGLRNRCGQCDDYDLCLRCIIDAQQIHDPSHSFRVTEES